MPNGTRQKQMYASWVHGNAGHIYKDPDLGSARSDACTLPRSRTWHPYVLFVITFLTVVSLLVVRADAASIEGKVTFVGTMEEVSDGDSFHAMFRVRVYGRCQPIVPANWELQDRNYWLHVKSGLISKTPHNGPNLINAYSTLLTALTSTKKVQINGVNHCQVDGQPLSESLWRLQIGIYN